jgi:Uri superfamily endonuclease
MSKLVASITDFGSVDAETDNNLFAVGFNSQQLAAGIFYYKKNFYAH